jgi:choline dehydrogenase-like flavoprotein
MSQAERFEILILGSGAGGKLLAWQMARSGRRTAVVNAAGSAARVPTFERRFSAWITRGTWIRELRIGTSGCT